MAELKTKQTEASVKTYLDAIEDEQRRADCLALVAIMRKVTKLEPKMWGSAIVGFGSYHYKYESGHEGDACLVGFSSRKGDISVYIISGFEDREKLLGELGKHKTGKACLYLKRLSDIKVPILEKLIKESVAEMRRRYPG
ncbi:MAG: DUF1801 domain-containing protein [Usitatibacteraceae bacterium]